jgi:Skp family chaperone for outer membrane proteins
MKTPKPLWAAAAVAAVTLMLGTVAVSAQPAPAKPAPPAAAATGRAPTAVILFLDRGTVLRQSSVGKGMYAQVEALAKKMETDFAPENKKLQADVQALQAQAAVLSADVRQAKVKELEARRAAFQKKVQDRQAASATRVLRLKNRLGRSSRRLWLSGGRTCCLIAASSCSVRPTSM